jgi:beta-xylosidase
MLHRIDSTHGNPYGLWQTMGAPPFPTPKQATLLKAESESNANLVPLSGPRMATLYVEANALVVVVI